MCLAFTPRPRQHFPSFAFKPASIRFRRLALERSTGLFFPHLQSSVLELLLMCQEAPDILNDVRGLYLLFWDHQQLFDPATRSFRPIVQSCLLTGEGWTETPVDDFRSEAGVELDFLLTLRDESFVKSCCLMGLFWWSTRSCTVVRSHISSRSFEVQFWKQLF